MLKTVASTMDEQGKPTPVLLQGALGLVSYAFPCKLFTLMSVRG